MFKGAIDELESWDVKPHYICPFLTNEPFLDNRIYDLCSYVNLKLPGSNLVFFTNGSLFTEQNLLRLGAVKNISAVYVSLHHSNAKDYELELGLKWSKTLEAIHYLIAHCKTYKIKPVILRVQDGDIEKDRAFIEFCKGEFHGTQVQLSYRYNWKGDIGSSFWFEISDTPCPRHSSLCVLWDGRVALCCLDQNGDYSLGKFPENTLLNIYNGETAKKYRTQSRRLSVPCNRCNMR